MKLEEIDINLIVPYKKNPREIPIESEKKQADSMKELENNKTIKVKKVNIITVGEIK